MSRIVSWMKKSHTLKMPLIGDLMISLGRTILAFILGLFVCAVLVALFGVNPLEAYGDMLYGAFGTFANFTNVLVRASPLILGGMGVALGIKAGIWNTGIEGYMYLGAIGAAIAGIPDLGIPKFFHILLVFLCAMAFAGVWGLIPGVLRARVGVNEVTSTIMLNYVAIYLTTWFVSDPQPLAEPDSFYPMSKQLADSALLPILMKGTSFHPGIFIGIGICILFSFILFRTSFGFKVRMLGGNSGAARYAGVNSGQMIIAVMVIGAMLGGLSGAIEVTGLRGRVYMEFVTGVGYQSVAVALVAGGSPIGVIVAGMVLAVLKAGGSTMSVMTNLPSSMSDIIIAVCVLFVIAFGIGDAHATKKKEKKPNLWSTCRMNKNGYDTAEEEPE